MKRLLAALLVLLMFLVGCDTTDRKLPSEASGELAGGSGEASIETPLQGGPSQGGSSALEKSLQESSPEPVPVEIIPESALPRPEAALPEESSFHEEPSLPELLSEFSYAGTPLSPEPSGLGYDAAATSEAQPQSVIEEDIDTAIFEEELFRLINAEREARGANALGMEDHLRWAARLRAPEVLASLSHTRLDGSAYYTAFEEADFDYAGKWHGENVSQIQFPIGMYTSREAAAFMFEQLRASSGHLSNMVSEHYGQIGIGAALEISGDTVRIGSAQLFMGF